jgi:hypothetical protein
VLFHACAPPVENHARKIKPAHSVTNFG